MKKGIVAIIVALLIAFSFNIAYADNFASAGAALADCRFASIEFFDPNLVTDVTPNDPVAYEYREVLGVKWQVAMVVIATPDCQDIGVLGDARSTVANFAMEAYKSKKPIKIGRVDGRIVSIGLADWD
jgi:hypothetical protein